MNEVKNKVSIAGIDIAIGAAVCICLLICHIVGLLGYQIQALAACTGAVMCVQDGKQASWGAGINRILGVLCGGSIGIALVLLDSVIHHSYIFCILVGAGVIGNLLLCKLVKLPPIQGRVSCMSLLLVMLVLHGTARVQYAFGRLIGTLVGAAIALLVSMALAAMEKRRNDHGQ
ncbi:MAG: FUSC family protein [Faecousia sp.]